jgi:hypothetical protein
MRIRLNGYAIMKGDAIILPAITYGLAAAIGVRGVNSTAERRV